MTLRCAWQRIAKTVGVAGADDLPARDHLAEEVAALRPNFVEAVDPGENVGCFERLDGLFDGIAATFGRDGDGLVARKTIAGPAVVELPEHGDQHPLKGGGDRAVVLAWLPVLRVVQLDAADDGLLGLLAHGRSGKAAEDFLAGRAGGWLVNRHGLSIPVEGATARRGLNLARVRPLQETSCKVRGFGGFS